MGWTRMPRRNEDRRQRRPALEGLETRTLLSQIHGFKPRHSGEPPSQTPVAALVSLRPHHASPALPRVVVPAGASSTADGATNVDAIIGASAARSTYHVDGAGSTVAVIDGGVNYNHEALGGGLGAGHKVIGGWDFADDDADPAAKTMDHGTAVAGLIASSDPSDPGVAPGADLVSLRVFDDKNVGDFGRVAAALQWVIDNHTADHITAVNLSMSDGATYAGNWFAQDGQHGQELTTLIGRLDALNIPVITATGNSFNGSQGDGFPSVIGDTISVTATDASDHVVADAQRLGTALGVQSATKVAAPGAGDLAPLGGDSFGTVTGTSFSAPLVSGAVVLLQQVYQQRFGALPTVRQLTTWLQNGSDPVNDPVTGVTIGRLDIPKALAQVPYAPVAQTLAVATPVAFAAVAAPTAIQPPAAFPVSTPIAAVPVSTPTPPAVSPNLSVWVNGQTVIGGNVSSPNASKLPAWLVSALPSFARWWSSPSDSQATKLQVWGNS